MDRHIGRWTSTFLFLIVVAIAAQANAAQVRSGIQAERESVTALGIEQVAEADLGSPVVPTCFFSAAPPRTAAELESPGWGKRDALGTLYFLARDRGPDHVATAVPDGLPKDYLDADPVHGAVVDFTDDRDSRGTRVTARCYADGYAVIETPKTSGKN